MHQLFLFLNKLLAADVILVSVKLSIYVDSKEAIFDQSELYVKIFIIAFVSCAEDNFLSFLACSFIFSFLIEISE